MPRPTSANGARAIAAPPFQRPLRVRSLSPREPVQIELAPDAAEAEAIAEFLGLRGLTALRLDGTLSPQADGNWRLEGRLLADVVQTCVATLDPVTSHIDEALARDYVPADTYTPPAEIDLDPEAEDDPDPFEDVIDPAALALESLALALDPYPRARDAPAAEWQVAPPGATPLDDADLKPFAKLALLKETLGGEKP